MNKAKELLEKYAAGKCSPEELALLETWYLQENEPKAMLKPEQVEQARLAVWEKLAVQEELPKATSKSSKLIWYWTSAAAALLIISFSVAYFTNKPSQVEQQQISQNIIVPGSNKATLILADGQTIDLGLAKEGLLNKEQGIAIYKTKDGQIQYQTEQNNALTIQWNELSIPVGGYYSLSLADGTKVWLNSKSKLKYPTNFSGDTRRVELEGEAYFEVAHRKDQAFIVSCKQQNVEVLGTHFNINAYPDEKGISTTLLEGKVKVSAAGQSLVLKPNEQSLLIGNKLSLHQNIETEDVVDWVNNDFIFKNEDLASILRKLSRWYDIEAVYPEELGKLEFSGSISRKKNIQQVLKIMELTELVHFKIEERRVTVTK